MEVSVYWAGGFLHAKDEGGLRANNSLPVRDDVGMAELHNLSALEQSELLRSRDLSATELTEHYLERIEQLNPTIRAFTTVSAAAALEKSAAIDSAREVPTRHDEPLWGLPFADKDLNDRAGVVTTYGSAVFEDYVPDASSPIVTDMDSAGGVSLGKTNVPEFGFPAYARNRLSQGFARNPWDLTRDPGGSSSGAAAAVAARMLPFAPGNDAGGSVRIPAGACGLVGLKTSRGRIPGESGLNALAGLPVGGPLARSVADAALLLDGMVHGPNRYALRAPQAANMPSSGSFVDALDTPTGPLNIGWNEWSPWATHYDIAVDPQASEALQATLEAAAAMGHTVTRVEPSEAPQYVDAFREIWMASAAALPLPEEMLPAVEPLTSWLVRTGRKRPAANLPRALAQLKSFEAQIIADYAPYDIILTPSLAMTPRPWDWFDEGDGEQNFIQQCQFTPFTSYLNVAGLPAISMPVAMSRPTGSAEAGLPLGVQAIGRPGDEATLLRFAKAVEEVFDWARRAPLSSV